MIVIEAMLSALHSTLRDFPGSLLHSSSVVTVNYGILFGGDVNIEMFLYSCSVGMKAAFAVFKESGKYWCF